MATYVKCQWQNKPLVFDFESITAREYKVIKRHTGLKMGEFENSFVHAEDGIEMECIDCLLWLFLKRNGHEIVDPEQLPDYSPAEFMSSFDVIQDAKPAEGEAPLVEASEPTHT